MNTIIYLPAFKSRNPYTPGGPSKIFPTTNQIERPRAHGGAEASGQRTDLGSHEEVVRVRRVAADAE